MVRVLCMDDSVVESMTNDVKFKCSITNFVISAN